jgi:hypothetical protein
MVRGGRPCLRFPGSATPHFDAVEMGEIIDHGRTEDIDRKQRRTALAF